MNLLRVEGHSFTDGSEEKSLTAPLESSSPLMRGDGASSEIAGTVPLEAHQDARAVVRLVQCRSCSKPFRTPVTLPCGHSVCRACLPMPHLREGISYPNTPGRIHGVRCPLADCGAEHPTGECNIDVTLSKVMEAVATEVARHRLIAKDVSVLLETISRIWDEKGFSEKEKEVEKSHTRVLNGGRLVATFALAEMGELDYSAGVNYQDPSGPESDYKELDDQLLNRLREATNKELECQICYSMMLDPLTTTCGHTYCRKCLARVLDHSPHCPMCRRALTVPPSLGGQPSNAVLTDLLNSLCPELVAARAEAVAREERDSPGESNIPLFCCTLGFPSMPTYLHIFEPRYRLMIRRALQGNRKFGMVMYNRAGISQGDMGNTQFVEYGTVLQIINNETLPDGRSFIETRGVSRFRVRSFSMRDGYLMGNVERVEDLSLAEEERLEAEEVRAAVAELMSVQLNSADASSSQNQHYQQQLHLNALSTRELLLRGIAFIQRMQSNSAPWLSRRIMDAYGVPPDDPALFPYWFASVLPIAEEEKYLLLKTTSVRARLKIVNQWIRRIEGQRT